MEDRSNSDLASSSFLPARFLLEALEPRTLYSVTPASTPAEIVAQANNAFAFDLFQQLRQGNSGDVFFSPYSIATALEMTLQGAEGATATEMIQALHLPSSDIAQAGIQALNQLFQADPATAGYSLSTANRLWVNENMPLLDSYLTNTQNIFGAGAQSIDYSNPGAAAATINAWVANQTNGKIQNLIPSSDLNTFTVLVLTNAIYFKGSWANAFDASLTQAANFGVTPTQTETVQMMQQTAGLGYYAQPGADGFQALDLPYVGNLDMLVILPTASNFDAFESGMNSDLFSQITSNLASTEVDVQLPKFTLNESYDLNAPLENLGIHTAFGDSADFSGISSQPINISDVVHKSFIQVDETGTEAAAATGVVMTAFCVSADPTPPVSFDADHPFLFAIRDRSTNTILFLGQVTDPGNDGSSGSTSAPAPSSPINPIASAPIPVGVPAFFPAPPSSELTTSSPISQIVPVSPTTPALVPVDVPGYFPAPPSAPSPANSVTPSTAVVTTAATVPSTASAGLPIVPTGIFANDLLDSSVSSSLAGADLALSQG